MKLNYFLKPLKLILYLVTACLLLEAGLQTRDLLVETYEKQAVGPNQSIQILVIGDSVFGDENDPNSILNKLKTNLSKATQGRTSIVNEVHSGNSSSLMSSKIQANNENFKPTISVILLGNSDYIVNGVPNSKSHSTFSLILLKNLSKSRLFRLTISLRSQIELFYLTHFKSEEPQFHQKSGLEEIDAEIRQLTSLASENKINCMQKSMLAKLQVNRNINYSLQMAQETAKCVIEVKNSKDLSNLYANLAYTYQGLNKREEAEKYFELAFKTDETNYPNVSQYAWYEYEHGNCSKFLNLIEKLFTKSEPSRRTCMIMRECYIKLNKISEGEQFFKRFLKSETSSYFKKQVLQSFEIMKGGQDSEVPDALGNRDDYLLKLIYFRVKLMNKEANNLFLKKDLYSPIEDSQIDTVEFLKLITNLESRGSTVFVLQYPNQSDWRVLTALAGADTKATFVSLSSVFEKHLDQFNILDLLAGDFLHVTPAGAALIADHLSSLILTHLKQDQNVH